MLLYPCSVPSLGVIPYPFLEAEAREQHGTPGRHTKMSPQFSVPWFRRQPYKPSRNGWGNWSDLWSYYTIAQVASRVSVTEVRKQLFTQKSRSIDGLPPTQAELIQHIKWATYQAGHCWAQMMIAAPELPSPSEWGWSKKAEGGWEVCWTTLPEATQACRELIRCGCKKSCRGRCKYQKAALQCTALCLCGGLCTD